MIKPLRFLFSAVIASVVVLGLLVASLAAFGLFDQPEETLYVHPVEVLSQSDRVDVAELIGAEQDRRLPERRVAPPIEPLEIPRREVSGFVQIEVEVDAQGRVREAQVVNALPAGVYEDQALRQVRQRRYPARAGGETYIEVVPFKVDPDAIPPDGN